MENLQEINAKGKYTFKISTKPIDKKIRLENNIFSDIFVRFFDKEEYAKEFINKGQIKLNTLSKLRKLENARVDENEGILKKVFIDTSAFAGYEQKYFMGLLRIDDIIHMDIEPKCEEVFVYCLSYLKIKRKEDMNLEFIKKHLKENYVTNKFAVLIFDVQRFMNAVKFKIEEELRTQRPYFGLVEYKETTPFDFLGFQDGDLFFRQICYVKSKAFEKEREFRIAANLKGNSAEVKFLKVGSLQSFCELIVLD